MRIFSTWSIVKETTTAMMMICQEVITPDRVDATSKSNSSGIEAEETGLVYSFTAPKLQLLATQPEGKNLVQACLLAPTEGAGPVSKVMLGSNSSGLQDQGLRPLGQTLVRADRKVPVPAV
ncbi:transcription factor of the MADS box [Tulasnella sp. JGI-2019a]|nr:transcription factor of the MADS box [Tulasnella sp. JGI-2019a]KAG9004877.1 transcription factor of the MADS box [Tulasnella sp. JGI-2019a]